VGVCVLKNMKVKNSINNFLMWKSTYMKSSNAYKTALRPLVELYGEKEMQAFTINDVSRLLEKLNGRYARSTVYNFTAILKMFTRYAHYSHINTVSPELIKVRRVELPVSRPFVTEEDVEMFCELQDESTFVGIRNIVILNMLFETGTRISELLSLTLDDLGDGQKNEVTVVTLKNGKPRVIMWSKHTHKLLQAYLAVLVSKKHVSKKLFINKNGEVLTARGVQHMLTTLREEVGMERKITPHSFRHGKAHRMVQQGANIKEIGVVLGHSEDNPRSALQYLRLDLKESRNIVSKYI
jgi:site-specific recombinase XerD